MTTLVDLAGPAFRSPGAKRIVAERLGSTVAELRSEIADAIALRLKSSGLSKSAARKQALEIAFDNPGVIVAALLTRRSSAKACLAPLWPLQGKRGLCNEAGKSVDGQKP